MLDQETIAQQLDLLAAHRRALAALLQQQMSPDVASRIEDVRAEVRGIKVALREGGVAVEDEPNDEGLPVEAVQPQQASGSQISINTGGANYVDSGGGDVAGRDIDKRQGAVFVEGNVYRHVIGQQTNYYQPATFILTLSPPGL
jgi:hypothetical protein